MAPRTHDNHLAARVQELENWRMDLQKSFAEFDHWRRSVVTQLTVAEKQFIALHNAMHALRTKTMRPKSFIVEIERSAVHTLSLRVEAANAAEAENVVSQLVNGIQRVDVFGELPPGIVRVGPTNRFSDSDEDGWDVVDTREIKE